MSIIFSVGIVILLLNEYYYHVVLKNKPEHKILRGLKNKYDMIAFGSSYGLYGISFPKDSNGFNFCLGGQFFYYTDKMLREYAPRCLNSGGTVYLIIADLVFAEVGKGLYNSERYPLILSKKSLGDEYSLLNYLRMRFPFFFNRRALRQIARTMIKGVDNGFDTLTLNQLNYEETLQQAKKRCFSWCQQFHLNDTQTNKIPVELEEKFSRTCQILTSMIQFCYDEGYKPVLVVTPVSSAMNECMSDAFIKKVLYDNIEKANVMAVPFLNYLRDGRFQDISLYANNADYLNARGRLLFTKELIIDSKYISQ